MRKTHPHRLSAVKIQPEAKKPRIQEAKRQRIEVEGATSSPSTTRLELMETRVEEVNLEGDKMYHLDEVVDVETLKLWQ